MWILTGLLLGSLVTSTHDTEEQCEGRKAMLVKTNVQTIDCRKTISYLTSTHSNSIKLGMGCSVVFSDGRCAN